ncbi:MAG: hypothetical protein IJH83_02105 [Coriobacteriales bacterium]|nr:hypothetical protein [Coriobacteriales bacterium]
MNMRMDACGGEFQPKTDGLHPTMDEVKAMPPVALELVSICSSSSSSGMVMGDHSSYSATIEWGGSQPLLTIEDAPAFKDRVRSVYRVDPQVPERIKAIVVRENMCHWGKLPHIPSMMDHMLDYSSSSSLTLIYDGFNVATRFSGRVSIDVRNVRSWGGGEALDRIDAIFKECERDDALVSRETTPPMVSMGGFMGMGMQPQPTMQPSPAPATPVAQPPAGAWTCPECGQNANLGKFCCECGSPRL